MKLQDTFDTFDSYKDENDDDFDVDILKFKMRWY